jgi:antitoxin ParD1/3/4
MGTTPQTEKLSISLPGEMAKWIREKVDSGSYSSNSEIIREGLRLLQDHDERRTQKLKALQNMVEESIKSGPGIPAEEVFTRMEERNRQWRKKKS